MAQAIHHIDRGLSADEEKTMSDRIKNSQSAYLHRSACWLVAAFAAVALLLGTVGLYGVIAYSVGQRTREIGVGMALGAQRASVYRLILREAAWLAALGSQVASSAPLLPPALSGACSLMSVHGMHAQPSR